MDGEQSIVTSFESHIFVSCFLLEYGSLIYERIDHDISDEMYSFSDTFISEICHSTGLCDEEKIRYPIGEYAIDLFRHIHIERA